MSPSDRKYTREHEWVKMEDVRTNRALVGITEYAKNQLGDIVYFDLPQPGTTLTQLKKMGEVESVKAVSDIFSPVSGQVVEVNSVLADHPELVNEDPYEAGWLARVIVSDPAELQSLMSADEYEAYVRGLT